MEKWSTAQPESFPSMPSFGYLDTVPTARRPVAVPLLLPGTLVTVRTRNTVYRLVVLDGPTGRVSITGGRLFPQSTEVQLLGAPEGEDDVKVGWIVEGLQLHLITFFGPVITSVVESVDVDVDTASVTDEDTDSSRHLMVRRRSRTPDICSPSRTRAQS